MTDSQTIPLAGEDELRQQLWLRCARVLLRLLTELEKTRIRAGENGTWDDRHASVDLAMDLASVTVQRWIVEPPEGRAWTHQWGQVTGVVLMALECYSGDDHYSRVLRVLSAALHVLPELLEG